jgi:hypothetical protein
MTVSGQPAVNYTFDAADRPTQITQGGSTVQFSYDAANRRYVDPTVNKWDGWQRTFHLDYDPKYGPHFNSDMEWAGKSGLNVNHASIPGWLQKLGTNRSLERLANTSAAMG